MTLHTPLILLHVFHLVPPRGPGTSWPGQYLKSLDSLSQLPISTDQQILHPGKLTWNLKTGARIMTCWVRATQISSFQGTRTSQHVYQSMETYPNTSGATTAVTNIFVEFRLWCYLRMNMAEDCVTPALTTRRKMTTRTTRGNNTSCQHHPTSTPNTYLQSMATSRHARQWASGR